MANVFNMGGGTDLVNATLKPGNKIVYSDGLEYHSEIPTEEKIVPVLGSSVVYAPYGLTGEVTALADQGFWFVTGDFISQSSVPTASLEPVSGVTYTNGIADLDPSVVNDIARAISNNSSINYTTEVVYIDLATMHRKISVGDEVQIQFGNALYQFRIIGFNTVALSNSTAYGSVTATGAAGFVFEMVSVYAEPYPIWVDNPSNGSPKSYNPGNSDVKLYSDTLPALKETIPVAWRSLIKFVHQKYATRMSSSDAKTYTVDLFFHTPDTLNVGFQPGGGATYLDYTGRTGPYAYYKNVTVDKWKKKTPLGVASTYILDLPYGLNSTAVYKYPPVFEMRSNPTYVEGVDGDPISKSSGGTTNPSVYIAPLFCI